MSPMVYDSPGLLRTSTAPASRQASAVSQPLGVSELTMIVGMG